MSAHMPVGQQALPTTLPCEPQSSAFGSRSPFFLLVGWLSTSCTGMCQVARNRLLQLEEANEEEDSTLRRNVFRADSSADGQAGGGQDTGGLHRLLEHTYD